jgi:hypothetical protein
MDQLILVVSTVVIMGMLVHHVFTGRMSIRVFLAFLASLIIPLLVTTFAYVVLPRETF